MKAKILLISIILLIASCAVVYAEDRVSLGFLYGSTSDLSLIDRTNGSINQVSPTCFDLDNKGNLVVTGNLTHAFVEQMHERGIIVTPFLSNHWVRSKGRKALKNANALSDSIVCAIKDFDLDGVNVDIENLNEDDREDLSEFVRMLREKLPEGKLLTVSVAANPFEKENGWQGSYDYEKLGKYADYLFVMTYDEHSIGSPEGPVASNAFVENSIIYALNYVSKDKIVMGIPFFGRYWKTDEESGGAAIVGGTVENLLKRKDITINIEDQAEIGESKVTITVPENMHKPISINGDEWEAGEYIVWYHSNEDIKIKLQLINKYDLLGSGVWALGQEKVEVWKYYKDELNKTPRQVTPVEEKIDLAEQRRLAEEARVEELKEVALVLADSRDRVNEFTKEFVKDDKVNDSSNKESITRHGVKLGKKVLDSLEELLDTNEEKVKNTNDKINRVLLANISIGTARLRNEKQFLN
jgi:spore germination protein YaaH